MGRTSARKGWLLIISQMGVEEVVKVKKIFNSSVQIMLMTMRMLNYPSLRSYPCDNHFKEEEILPNLHYYLNPGATLYYM
jgi:hypothetical protein